MININIDHEFEKMANEHDMPIYKYICDDGTENQYENRNTATAYDFYSKGWKRREKLAQYEIQKLKAKLAQYEGDSVVTIPREPSKEMLDALESGVYWDFADTTFDSTKAFKAMIQVIGTK